MRTRIYEIPLQSDDMREKLGTPSVTVYADRSVSVHPTSWASTPPTRSEAANALRQARRMGYDITRREL